MNPLRGPRPANQVGPEHSQDRDEFLPIQWRTVTESYFRALRIPVLTGRTFDRTDRPPSDDAPGEGLAVISRHESRVALSEGIPRTLEWMKRVYGVGAGP